MTIRIRNDSTSAVVRGYAVDSHHTVIWRWLPDYGNIR
jgi:hypothetical protein